MTGTIHVCKQYKLDLANGLHQPGDVYKIALYTSTVGLTEDTSSYSTANEVPENAQTTYLTGGQVLTGRTAALDQGVAVIDWNDPVWASSSISANGALIYNASRGNKALVAMDFGEVLSSRNGPFSVQFPPATADEAVIVIV